MSVVRVAAALAALWCSSWFALAQDGAVRGPSTQDPGTQDPDALAPEVVRLVDATLQGPSPEAGADAVWQAASAAHGECTQVVAELRRRIEADDRAATRRLLCGVLRYQGRTRQALRVLDGIDVALRTDADLLLRAELLDALGKGDDAGKAYEDLLARELEPALRRRILFRRALVGSDSIQQLRDFAASDGNDREQRNQAAIILALRNEPKAALELYEVSGEGTARFRQLVRLAEWALAADEPERAQQLAWEAVDVAKMRRDRRYALTVVVSAYRAGDAIDALLQRFEAAESLDKDARQIWIDLLRDEGRVDDALRLFRQEGDGAWTPALRRQLLEICRETGREAVLVSQFEELIAAEPDNLEWRSGLSRHYLESGDRERARAAWQSYGKDRGDAQAQLDAAFSLMELGLDDLAEARAKAAAESASLRRAAQMFIVKLHVNRGRFRQATTMLDEIERTADGRDSVLSEVAGIYERIDRLDKAVGVLDRMREAYGGFLGTDLDMKYALLLSKVDREHDALAVWRSLWTKVRSTPRGRYVEDRMMTVASRLGVLAKIAIELEDRLDAGTADTTDVELLVRLYIKVGDSAAATEITEQALRGQDVGDVELIRRKATIYLACQDYREYEELIEQLIRLDPDNRVEHMRELTLSRLERGRRAQAIENLPKLREAAEDGGIADEFEAGIFQLAGLTDRALKSYTKGLGRYPDRIDTHLLVANLMRETGSEMEAARRFQYLAATAERDDLFTIAIDGILNLRAQQQSQVPNGLVEWAMRVTLERLAERSHRFYLHRLAADLAEELNDMPMSIRTLTAGIPVAGERRTALLREILGKIRSLDRNARVVFGGSRQLRISPNWDYKPYVMVGRRLLGQGEVVPPQVFMDLAAVFLHAKAVPDAMRTFSRAAELLDRAEVNRQAAAVLEQAERYEPALQFYRRLLSVDVTDVALMAKIARLEELVGRDDAACAVYRQGLASALQQTQDRVHVATEEEPDPNDILSIYGGQRNVDALQQTIPLLVEGLLVTLPEADAEAFLTEMAATVERDLQQLGAAAAGAVETIGEFPRLRARADALRRLCLCFRHLPISDAIDARLLQRFPTDRELARQSIGYRAERGFHVAATRLLQHGEFADDPAFAWLRRSEVGDGPVAPAVAASHVVPMLVGRKDELRTMLQNVDAAAIDPSNVQSVPLLLGACILVGADDAAERIARAGVRITASMSERQRVLQNRESANTILNLASRLDPDLRQRLLSYRVERTAAKGAKALVSLQYELEAERDFQLDPDRIEEMLRAEVANSAQEQFGLRSMNLLHFLPQERRAPLVRELYTSAPRSQRLNVLTEGADFVPEPLSDGFLSWYEGVFRREFEAADQQARRRAGFGYSEIGSKRLMRLRLEASLSMGGSHREWLRLLQIVVDLDDRAAAARMLEEGIPAMITRDDLAGVVPNRPKGLNKRQVDDAVRQIVTSGLQQQAIAVVERKLQERPEHEALRYMQWQLRTKMPGAVAFVERALQDGGDDVDLLERAMRFQRQCGRLVDATETLQRLVELDEKRAKSWRSQLAALHVRLGNQPAADALRKQQAGAARPGARPSQPATSAARLISSSGAVVQAVSLVGGRPAPRASAKVSALLKADDPIEAERDLRRIWRGRGRERRGFVIGTPPAEILISQQDLAALAGKEFAVAEARRMRRLLEDSGQLDSKSLLGALLAVAPKAEHVSAAIDELLATLERGEGGTAEAVQLLTALANEELPDAQRRRVVDLLLHRRETPDEARLRNVAHELVRDGRKTEAAALYRLAILAGGEGLPAYLLRNRKEQPGDVIRDVQQRLGDELGRETAVALFDDKLATEDSASMMLAALKAWPQLLTEDELAERLVTLQARIERLRGSRLGRLAYDRDALPMMGELCKALARVGRAGEALVELEPLLCGARPDMYGRTPPRNASQVQRVLDELLQLELADREAWLRTIGERVVAWQQAGRLADASKTLAAVGLQLAEAGLSELAGQCADGLAELAVDDATAEQQLAALWRALGDETRAYTLEKTLLTRRRLAIAELPRVLQQLRDNEGPPVAFAAGEQALAYTRDPSFLEKMIELADEVGQSERADGWRQELEERKPKPAEQPQQEPAAAGRG
ncbi:MAG: hypothetical protein ACE37K_00630 [Planctomycetota bacterium]